MSRRSNTDEVRSCPCGSGATYDSCCGRWHAGAAAPSAEALMRSRYSAFTMQLKDYLRTTWHPRTRPQSLEIEPLQKWLGLKIVATRATGTDSAEVEFIARFRIGGGSAARLHERSRFVREDGRWLYVDGDFIAAE
jgi:SEC-C motif-containing protein